MSIYNLCMSAKQKIINLITIIVALSTLYYLTTNLNQQQQTTLTLFEAIANAQPLDNPMLKSIEEIGSSLITTENEVSPTCFIQVYYQIVVKKQINPEKLFALFEDSSQEYDQITNCSHYLALLIHRAQQLPQANRVKIIPELIALQKGWLQQKYPKNSKQLQICAYFNSYNNQQTIKNQVKALATQKYQNTLILIEDDGSTDNTPIFAKYILQEAKNEKVTLVLQKQRRGILSRLPDFLGKCQEDAIVIVLSGNDTLLEENVFWTLDRVFTNNEVDLAFLSSLTTPHASLQTINRLQDPNSVYTPSIAFRKRIAKSIKAPTSTDFGLERNILAYQLKKAASSSKIIGEVVISRPANKDVGYLARLQKLVEQLDVA